MIFVAAILATVSVIFNFIPGIILFMVLFIIFTFNSRGIKQELNKLAALVFVLVAAYIIVFSVLGK